MDANCPVSTEKEKIAVAAFVGDIHYRISTPEYRIEKSDFHKVINNKLREMFRKIESFEAYTHIPIFVAGDMFDKARDFLSFWNLARALEEYDYPGTIYVVPGQHDQFHHNQNDTCTSLNALSEYRPCNIEILSGTQLERVVKGRGGWNFFGCGWGEEYLEAPEGDKNVLITHRSLWHNKPIYPGQTEGNVVIETLRMKQNGYRHVFSGDNHKAFNVEMNGVSLFNLGAFTRNSVDLAKQQPRFCVLFDDGSVESFSVGERDVFEMERSDDDKERAEKQDAFSSALAGGFAHTATFKQKLEEIVAAGECGELKLNEEQRSLLRDVVNEID